MSVCQIECSFDYYFLPLPGGFSLKDYCIQLYMVVTVHQQLHQSFFLSCTKPSSCIFRTGVRTSSPLCAPERVVPRNDSLKVKLSDIRRVQKQAVEILHYNLIRFLLSLLSPCLLHSVVFLVETTGMSLLEGFEGFWKLNLQISLQGSGCTKF